MNVDTGQFMALMRTVIDLGDTVADLGETAADAAAGRPPAADRGARRPKGGRHAARPELRIIQGGR